jgi:hypothetical protein
MIHSTARPGNVIVMSSPQGRLVPKHRRGPKDRSVALVLLVALVLPLAGCATTGDTVATVVTAPGQYDLYDCPAIKVAATGVAKRQRELEELMARAGRGGGLGGLVSATTYEPKYAMQRGRMNELRRVAAEKHCSFVPGPTMAPTPTRERLPPPPKTRPR